MNANTYTHYFKEAVVKNGVKYQHVIGLDETVDWRLILDLSDDPSWQLLSVKRPSVCRFPDERRRFFFRRVKYRCPCCGKRLYECEDRYPEGGMDLFPLNRRPGALELWHDDAFRCENCGSRIGAAAQKPALPESKRNFLGKFPILNRARIGTGS